MCSDTYHFIHFVQAKDRKPLPIEQSFLAVIAQFLVYFPIQILEGALQVDSAKLSQLHIFLNHVHLSP